MTKIDKISLFFERFEKRLAELLGRWRRELELARVTGDSEAAAKKQRKLDAAQHIRRFTEATGAPFLTEAVEHFLSANAPEVSRLQTTVEETQAAEDKRAEIHARTAQGIYGSPVREWTRAVLRTLGEDAEPYEALQSES